MSPLGPPIARAAGYRAPEVTDTRKSSQSSDVYSFGVLLLELLTAKSPVYSNGGDEVIHLVRWVHSVVREEWTAEVFDVELLRYPNIEEEMVEMLQIALACVVRMPEQRPKMPDVVRMIENVRMTDYEKQQASGAKSDNSTTPQDASGLESSTPLWEIILRIYFAPAWLLLYYYPFEYMVEMWFLSPSWWTELIVTFYRPDHGFLTVFRSVMYRLITVLLSQNQKQCFVRSCIDCGFLSLSQLMVRVLDQDLQYGRSLWDYSLFVWNLGKGRKQKGKFKRFPLCCLVWD